jgi:serine/threonine-protein kinase HipA
VYKPVQVIEVSIWGRRVGAVALDPQLRYYAFEYDADFVRTGVELAPIAMPLARAREPFVFTDLPEATYKRLPAMLADALPDDFGNALVNRWMAVHGVRAEDVTALDRLAYMGKRGMGALEFRPARGPSSKGSTALSLSGLVETARRAVRGQLDEDDVAKAALAQIIRVGTSAGGARAKAVVAWNPATDEVRAGQFAAGEGFEHWLLKFDGMGEDRELGGAEDYGRVEYAYHLMAVAAGVAMTPSRLLEENGRAHFMTRRFDRDGDRKHHVQTLCALAHLDYRQKASHDYNQLFQTVERLCPGYEAREEAFRRMAFNVMAANCDDHSKNFSFLLRQGGGWELAPAYDVTHAFNPAGEWTNQHLMSVGGKFDGIGRDDLLRVADRFGVGTAEKVLRRVGDAVGAWPDYARSAGVAEEGVARIRSHHRAL